MPELTQDQIENIQIDYGVLYVNFGEVGEKLLGPTRGGGTFDVKATRQEIEHDWKRGKEKGMSIITDINAMLSVTVIDTSIDMLEIAMPFLTRTGDVLSCKSSAIGVIPESAYLKNITEFCKLVSGEYKKITLYNAMNEKDFSLAAKAKSQGEVALEMSANWDPKDTTQDLYDIQDVASINGDTTPPTATTVPADAATGVVVSANLTATFSEDIKATDVNSDNFILTKASDGTIVAGTLTYTAATKLVTFNPTSDLSGATAYIWLITNVRDTAGNKMAPKVVNFTTA